MSKSRIKFLTSNIEKCLGCKGCELACATGKAERYLASKESSNRTVVPNIIVIQGSKHKIPAHCRHCEEAFCLKLCPTKAISKKQGVVVLDDRKCTGCGICEQGCPYGVITITLYSKDSSDKKIAHKCDMCIDRQLKDELPFCYSACPTKALSLQ